MLKSSWLRFFADTLYYASVPVGAMVLVGFGGRIGQDASLALLKVFSSELFWSV